MSTHWRQTAQCPHRFPDSARDADWLVAWTCAACGTVVSEYGAPPDDCPIDWRRDPLTSVKAQALRDAADELARRGHRSAVTRLREIADRHEASA